MSLEERVAKHKAKKTEQRDAKKRGGARPGAGGVPLHARPGIGTGGRRKTAQLAYNLMQEGEPPVGVMLKLMRAAFVEAYDPKKHKVKSRFWADKAMDWASKASPYVHPRLSSIEVVKGLGDDELQSLINGLAAQAGIVISPSGEGTPGGVPALEDATEGTGDRPGRVLAGTATRTSV